MELEIYETAEGKKTIDVTPLRSILNTESPPTLKGIEIIKSQLWSTQKDHKHLTFLEEWLPLWEMLPQENT